MDEKTKRMIHGLGLTFKILSGFMLSSGFLAFLIFTLLKIVASKIFPEIKESFFDSNVITFVFKNFGWLAFGQCALTAFIFYASFQFEKLRFWAKIVLEIFCWFLLLFMLSSVLLPPFETDLIFKRIITVFSMLPWLTGVTILIWLLRKKEVSAAFKNF